MLLESFEFMEEFAERTRTCSQRLSSNIYVQSNERCLFQQQLNRAKTFDNSLW